MEKKRISKDEYDKLKLSNKTKTNTKTEKYRTRKKTLKI